MANTPNEVFERALDLDEKERAELAALLHQSLDSESEEDVEAAWLTEIERRIAELDSGSTKVVPWGTVRARITRKLPA